MDPRDRLLRLIERVYAAPGSVEGWRALLSDLHTSFGGSGANFIAHDFSGHQASVSVSAGFAPEDIRTYVADWAALDPWARSPAVRRLPSGSVAVGEQLVTHAEMKRTAFYNDFGRRYGVVRCITGTIEVEERRVSVLSVNRGDKSPPFGTEETSLLEALMPHLQRALQLHRRLAASQALADGSTTALDLLAHGVLLLDTADRIMFANRTAEEILRACDGLMVDHKELFGARVSDTTTLRRLIAAAMATSGGQGTGAGGLVLIGRPSGRSPLRVLVTAAPPPDGICRRRCVRVHHRPGPESAAGRRPSSAHVRPVRGGDARRDGATRRREHRAFVRSAVHQPQYRAHAPAASVRQDRHHPAG
jgi:hypothetical protein